MLAYAETYFRHLVEWGILILEFFGTTILLVTAIISMYKWLKRATDVRTTISQGILLALAFKMGGEVLRTVIATETKELVSIFAIILLRGIVAAMIYWEISKEIRIESLYHEVSHSKVPSGKKEETQEEKDEGT